MTLIRQAYSAHSHVYQTLRNWILVLRVGR